MSQLPDAAGILRKYWGYDSFRPLQREIVESVLSGCDTLGLMPTGGGKSITFQVPGMMLEGVTIVVTPLISLMKDQVDNLKNRRIKALFLHSGMTLHENRVAREKMINGNVKFLYISPERLRNETFLSDLKQIRVSLIVVDEAHCISQWGYDFRPAYLNVKRLRKEKSGVPLLALTATATPEVSDDICSQLQMEHPNVYRMSFGRENINYIVRSAESKIQEVHHILSRTNGTAIVYVRSRKRTGDIADFLNSAGISASNYHAGLSYEVKEERQNAWKKGAVRVMVATNAFGMGIDKPDVRVVIHYDFPPSLEEYYQEAGRAGRDGKKSYAVLLCSRSDKGVMHRRVTEAFPDKEYILKVYERLCNFLHISLGEGYDLLKEFDIDKFCETFGYQSRQCKSALQILQRAGYIEYLEEADRRSKVMMSVHRNELYGLNGLSEKAERILTSILRMYTGLFSEYGVINEATISRVLNISENDVYSGLLELTRAKVLNYIPRSRTPLMYFPTSREEPKYLVIGKNIYEDRKKIMSRRIEAMLDYAFSSGKCRENRLLEYFGEKREGKCGTCDTCRADNSKHKNKEAERFKQVCDYLDKRSEGVDIRVLERDLRLDRKAISEILGFLTTEDFVSIQGTFITTNQSFKKKK